MSKIRDLERIDELLKRNIELRRDRLEALRFIKAHCVDIVSNSGMEYESETSFAAREFLDKYRDEVKKELGLSELKKDLV